MKNKTILLSIFLSFSLQSYSQCFTPTTLFASNINYYNADVNWNSTSGTHYYRIRYKIIGSSAWSFQNNLDSTLNTKLLTNLSPLSDYIWQIKSYCDTTNTSTSNWSVTDTFTTITSTCPNTNILFTTNINYNNATANWDTINGANRYKIRYKILGTSLWANLGPIYHPEDSITIPLLQQNTSYEWQIFTFHDTSNLLGSLWSASDTFTTTSFVAAPFNPIVINSLSTLQCNTHVGLSLRISQITNEPDIGTTVVTSDGGYFDISSISTGDSVGYATLATTTQTFNSTLEVGIVAGSNFAFINSVDSLGNIIGFFSIENLASGIKISSTSPNDGNNYTSGFTSELYFTNLYVTPSTAGLLYFNTDIESELGDQIYDTDSINIICINSIGEIGTEKNKLVKITDITGRECKPKKNTLLLYIYNDGIVERKFFIN